MPWQPTRELCCSFCRKSQDIVGKLISSNPSDYPRAYICDECIAVCNSIIEDGGPERRASLEPQGQASREPERQASEGPGRFAKHPLAEEFLIAAERWAVRDFTGLTAFNELDYMRELAEMMLTDE